MIIDAGIVGACAAIGAVAGYGFPTSETIGKLIWAVMISFFSAFFPQLAYERKIRIAKKEIV